MFSKHVTRLIDNIFSYLCIMQLTILIHEANNKLRRIN